MITSIAERLRVHRRLLTAIALSGLAATVAAVLSVATVSGLPPTLKGRGLEIGGAATHVLVDWEHSKVVDTRTESGEFDSLSTRTHLLGALMASGTVRDHIARRAGLQAGDIATVSRITSNVPATLKEPDSEQRANDIMLATKPYRLDIQPKATVPVLDVYAQAPSAAEAEQLANAAVEGLRDYLSEFARREGADPALQVSLKQLGRPRGVVINGRAAVLTAGFTFIVVFGICALLLGLAIRMRRRRSGPEAPPADAPPPAPIAAGRGGRAAQHGGGAPALAGGIGMWNAVAAPAPRVATRPVFALRLERLQELAGHTGDWPRTTRLLPWSIAAFIALLWLVPFNSIALSASGPVDLKLDRLVLPFLVVLWVLALASGGPGAPRLRLTWIHAGVAAFVAVACLSVVVDARSLNQSLELDVGIKKLTLLGSYACFFLIVASSIRRTEIRPFMKYTLVLAAICALGTIWEYRFHYNLFYDWSDKLLPGIFQVGQAESGAVDEIGRRLVRGPAELGLEAVAMLCMALPIALVGVMHSQIRRDKILYGLAACLLIAAAISTYRKSALLAPLSIGATLAYYRRGELLKLAPLALVALVAIHILSPGAFGSVALQLDSNRLGVATVSDRAADYDAVRPDLWSHLAFGRGYGTYDHFSYRILDSEILSRVVEVGLIGLAAYILMIVAVLVAARTTIRSRDPRWGPVGLAGAAAAVAFLVLSMLFDVMSFPHVPYIFLSVAGLLAVIVPALGEPGAAEHPLDRD